METLIWIGLVVATVVAVGAVVMAFIKSKMPH